MRDVKGHLSQGRQGLVESCCPHIDSNSVLAQKQSPRLAVLRVANT